MAANGIFALAPSRLGDSMSNRGVERIGVNYGHGVDLLRPKPLIDEKKNDTTSKINSLRVSKAREFGRKKTELGW